MEQVLEKDLVFNFGCVMFMVSVEHSSRDIK